MEINFDRSVFNNVFLPLLKDDSRYLALRGGAGSGKSWFAVQKILFRMLTEHNHRFLFVRKVGHTIRNSQYKLFKDLIHKYDLSQFFHFRETEMNIICEATNSEIITAGIDDREKLKSIAELTGVWIEEVTELTERDFRQVNMRLRGIRDNYKQTIVSFNPISDTHWIRKELFPPAIDEALDKKSIARWTKVVKVPDGKTEVKVPLTYACCHSTYEDNKFLDWEEKADLEDLKEKDFRYWLVYAKGAWGRVGNLVFDPPWKIKETPLEFDEIIYGLDFGYHHPTALVQVGIRDNVYYVSQKFYIKRMTKPEIIETLYSDMTSSNPQYITDPHAIIYADSAEPDTIADFANAGFNIIKSHKGNNSVKDSIDYVKSLEIYTDQDSHDLHRELRSFTWQSDKEGNPIEGKVNPYNDDLIAAARYALYSHSRSAEVKVG